MATAVSPAVPRLSELLPEAVAVAQTETDIDESLLLAEERRYIRDAVPRRRAEYATVRHCARQAFAQLGIPRQAVLTGAHREPLWPDGTVGSLTHCLKFRAGAVAMSQDIASLGIDAEENAALPDGVIQLVTGEHEQEQLNSLRREDLEIAWDRLLFSAKESIFKTWFPLTRQWIDFTNCTLHIDREQRRFFGRISPPNSPADAADMPQEAEAIHGVWAATATHLVTAAWIS